jgi:hypothetical protein
MKAFKSSIFVMSILTLTLAGAQQILVSPPAESRARTGSDRRLSSSASTAKLDPVEAARQLRAHRFAAAGAHSVDATLAPAGTVPCNGPSGTRFNLEPRANASIQEAPSTDFILNGVGMGNDLIVQSTSGAVESGPAYSGGGYFVHTSQTADCSVQFEGGLPPIAFQGDTLSGGAGIVKADNSRKAFFAANGVVGSNFSGIGLFRASASDLLNPRLCPNGTHTLAQAKSCWEQTRPAFLDQLPVFDQGGAPFLAVDERADGSGKGAGDVYVLYVSADESAISIVACTNSLQCGNPATIFTAGSGEQLLQFAADVEVTPSGVATVSFSTEDDHDGSGIVMFATCTPAGAPKAPVCSTPATVANLPASQFLTLQFTLENTSFLLEQTIPRHASRMASGNNFTTFLVFDDCRDEFLNAGAAVCVAGEVSLAVSTDSGKTWSKPISVDSKPGHHFFGNVAVDVSTGTASVVYFSTEGDPNFHKVRVMLNQIAPSSTQLGPPALITTKLEAADAFAPCLCFLNEVEVGAVSRGTGAAGHSRLYTSFNSSAVNGTYENRPLPDLNNHISLFSF